MNPEFRRQLWLQFSPSRLILMPALLLLWGAVAGLSKPESVAEALALGAQLAFVAIVYGMGINSAGASILEEIQERTWDQQRMSAMTPWAMTWGKLAGATSYSWYGGAICLLVFVPTALLAGWERVPEMAAVGVLGGILLQALLLAINLQLGRNPGKLAQRGGVWMVGILFIWSMGMVTNLSHQSRLVWWGESMDSWRFILGSLLVFTPCVLIAAWRQMAENLVVRQTPWAWPLFVLLLTVYVGGFPALERWPLSLVGLAVAAVLTYAALLSQSHPRTLWQRILNRAVGGDWLATLQQLPSWFFSLVLVWPFALLSTVALAPGAAGLMFDPQQPLVVACLLLRDTSLLLYFSFNPGARRPLGAFLVTLLVLYGLLPWLLRVLGLSLLCTLVFPLGGNAPIAGLAAVFQGGLACLLLWRQWVRTRP